MLVSFFFHIKCTKLVTYIPFILFANFLKPKNKSPNEDYRIQLASTSLWFSETTGGLDDDVFVVCASSRAASAILIFRCFPCLRLNNELKYIKRHLKSIYLLATLSIVVPHHIDQPQPTKQNSRVNAWATPTIQLMTKEPIRTRAPSCWEKRGMPKQRLNTPEHMVPEVAWEYFELSVINLFSRSIANSPNPGTKQLHIKQNHAKQTGRTGIAAFIIDVCSTNDISSLGRLSSGGNVGAILCFLLFILVRRLSLGFRLQQISLLQCLEQHPLCVCTKIKTNKIDFIIFWMIYRQFYTFSLVRLNCCYVSNRPTPYSLAFACV